MAAEQPPPEDEALAPRDLEEPDAEPHIVIDTTPGSRENATAAVMTHILARPDSIRQRAQNAATISSAFAAALVVAGVTQLARDENESWEPWTIALVGLALVCWVVAVWRFVLVVTHGLAPHPENTSYQALVDAYENHSVGLRARLRAAARWSGAALAVTTVALMVEVGERVIKREHERLIVLNEDGMAAVAALCGWDADASQADPRVRVKVSSDELSKPIMKLDVLSRPTEPVDPCHAPVAEMRLARSALVAVNDVQP